eukprot:TRINITY_DN2853_c2_g1_i2.p2 TRINITY_DN2853_c2_g1~~TRINITY_DN2853_c2_g1_i2.p2  ORF type:complete len:112 (+),score=4.27 TRINITY_DN2853_c2_g1_i2:692-1027(+)
MFLFFFSSFNLPPPLHPTYKPFGGVFFKKKKTRTRRINKSKEEKGEKKGDGLFTFLDFAYILSTVLFSSFLFPCCGRRRRREREGKKIKTKKKASPTFLFSSLLFLTIQMK